MADETHRAPLPKEDQHHCHVRRMAWGWWFFAAIALFYLLTEHKAHLFGFLPYIFLLACPLMHFFMHGKHGRHGDHGQAGSNEEDKK